MPEIDFAGVPDPEEWTPAPSGDYILELVDAEEGSAKSSGKPMSTLQFEIVDCDGELTKYNGRRIYENVTYHSEGALSRVKSMLRAFGAEVDDSENAEPLKFEWDDLLGKKLRARLRSRGAQQDPKTGREYSARNEIQRYIVPKE